MSLRSYSGSAKGTCSKNTQMGNSTVTTEHKLNVMEYEMHDNVDGQTKKAKQIYDNG
jgi:hypothetical protein